MADGAWYVGSERKAYGPIHPCPGLFRVASPVCSASFLHAVHRPRCEAPSVPRGRGQKGAAGQRPRRPKVLTPLLGYGPKTLFEAAVRDRAALAEPTGDFVHYWFGSQGNDPASHPAAREYLLRSDQARDP